MTAPIGYIVTKDGTPWQAKDRGRTSGCTKLFKLAKDAEREIDSRMYCVRVNKGDEREIVRKQYAVVPVSAV